jgi:hypothetical protein
MRRRHRNGWWETIAVITFAQPVSSSMPRWSPGPGFVEAMAATVWAKPVGADRAHAVVVLREDGRTVMLEGTVAIGDVLRLGGLCDKPHRIVWLAQTPPVSTVLGIDHPAIAYQDWCERFEEELDQLVLRLSRSRQPMAHLAHVEVTPGAGIQASMVIEVEAGPGSRDEIYAHAALLTGVLRHFGRGTRVRFSPASARDVIDPLYHRARQVLAPRRPTTPTARTDDPATPTATNTE